MKPFALKSHERNARHHNSQARAIPDARVKLGTAGTAYQINDVVSRGYSRFRSEIHFALCNRTTTG